MRITKSLILCFLFLLIKQAQSQNLAKADTSKTRLTAKESRVIRNLVVADTSFAPTQINLQLELLKHNANLLYKYRLDSIKTEIPLDYNQYVQTYIDVFLNQRKSVIGKMVSLGNYYFPIFENALALHHIPQEFKYLPIVESSLNPHAVSKSGATGLWQFMYITGKGYGLTMDNYVDERKDPVRSSYAAAAYLKDAYRQFGDWLLTLAAYNCGTGCVKRAITNAGGANNFWEIQQYLPVETQNYVPKFIAVTYMMQYYNRYHDIKIPDADFKINIDSIYVNRFVNFSDLANVLDIQQKELEILNPVYKKSLINGTIDSPKRLIIPKVDFKTYASLFDILNSDEQKDVLFATSLEDQNVYKKPVYHVVAKGESLASIANRYKIEVQDIKVWNNLSGFTAVPGQKLLVAKNSALQKSKEPSYLMYTVKVGDTLDAIAKKFEGVSIASIQQLNNLKNAKLTIGMNLKINIL